MFADRLEQPAVIDPAWLEPPAPKVRRTVTRLTDEERAALLDELRAAHRRVVGAGERVDAARLALGHRAAYAYAGGLTVHRIASVLEGRTHGLVQHWALKLNLTAEPVKDEEVEPLLAELADLNRASHDAERALERARLDRTAIAQRIRRRGVTPAEMGTALGLNRNSVYPWLRADVEEEPA